MVKERKDGREKDKKRMEVRKGKCKISAKEKVVGGVKG